MKVKTNTPIVSLEGKPIKVPVSDEKNADLAPLTMGKAMEVALLSQIEGERNTEPMASFDRYRLAERIHDAKDTVEITIDEAKLIKDRVAKIFGPLILGRVWTALEGTDA